MSVSASLLASGCKSLRRIPGKPMSEMWQGFGRPDLVFSHQAITEAVRAGELTLNGNEARVTDSAKTRFRRTSPAEGGYAPSVRRAICAMQRGCELRKKMVVRSQRYHSDGSVDTDWAAVWTVGGIELSPQAANLLTATTGDLIIANPANVEGARDQADYLIRKNTYSYRLTEKGKRIRWDRQGREEGQS